MKAIVLPDYNSNIIRAMKSLEAIKRNIPQPGAEEVLVRVAASPCNPSDIAFMRGGYNIQKPVPVTMGFECSGTVVDTGDSPEAKRLLGQKVSCFSQGTEEGTWAEYFATSWKNCIILDPELDMLQAGALCVNPFTAYALFQTAREKGCRTILQNGASGQVGVFIRTLARREGMRVVNIVRKPEHISQLEEAGEQWVLNSSDPDFEQKLADITLEKNACIGFDAVGGEMAGMMVNAMPGGSELIIYGGLSGKPACGINTLDIIFKGKSIRGFNLGQWKEEIGHEGFQEVANELQKLVMKGIMLTRIQGTFPLEEVQAAMEQYIRNMSSGKIMFVPGD